MTKTWLAKTLLATMAVSVLGFSGCGSEAEDKSTSAAKSVAKTTDEEKSAGDSKTNLSKTDEKTVAQTSTKAPKPGEQEPEIPVVKNDLDTTFLLPDFEVGIVVHPARVLRNPALQVPPIAEMMEKAKEMVGLDPRNVEQVLIAMSPLDQKVGIVIRFSKAVNGDEIVAKVMEDGHEVAEHKGLSYYQNADTTKPCAYMPDEQTAVIALQADLLRMMEKPAADSALITRLQTLNLDAEVAACVVEGLAVAKLREQVAKMQVPFLLAPLKELPELINAIALEVDAEEAVSLSLKLDAGSNDDSLRMQQIIDPMIGMGKGFALQQLAAAPPEQGEAAKAVLDSIKTEQQGKRFTVSLVIQQSKLMEETLANALPAILESQRANKATSDTNNLKLVGLAIHTYHDVYSQLPVVAENIKRDKDGNPLLSWRVHILPFIEQQGLYQQFKLDEPWDSDHNIKLLDQIPPTYVTTGNPGGGKTMVQAPIGSGSVFGGKLPVRIRDITDGTTNTIMAVLTKPENAVPWTKPVDWKLDSKDPEAGLQGERRGFLALFADGSVAPIRRGLDATTWANLVNRSDNKTVPEFRSR